jgi:thioesterase domain-containing protein
MVCGLATIIGAAEGTPERLVHLLPGQFGDGPGLARFRNWFDDRVAMDVVDLPDVAASTRLLTNISATARHVADTNARRQPEGPIHLAGCSLGGSIALEAARQLSDSGRKIGFLEILGDES